jgi:BAI1-associated protein 3
MIQSFKQDNTDSQCNETLEKVEYLLKLHGFETADLIHQYYIERWEDQQGMTEAPFGVLTVRATFTSSSVKIEVMNANNLLPMDSNGG